MKFRNKIRIPNRSKFGSRMHSNAPRAISMTRVSFADDGQCIGTEQVQAKLQFDPRNACYHIMIDDPICDGTESISDNQLEQLLDAISSSQREARQNPHNIVKGREAN